MATEKPFFQGSVPPQCPQQYYNTSPSMTTLPFNVKTDLNPYHRIYISKEYDMFKKAHYYESFLRDYKVFGELPDGDKKLLFTVSQHFQCNTCCEGWGVTCCCFSYIFCDKIIFQMDYRRNGRGFYTQGLNIQKGFHCLGCSNCKCDCPCAPHSRLFLRENIDPDNPDFNVGVHKGYTDYPLGCCCILCDRNAFYMDENNLKSYGIRAKCCDILAQRLSCIKGDFEIDIEDSKGCKTGNIMIYAGCYSQAVQGHCCYLPRNHFEINMPQAATSEQKFQIIADAIHFDLINGNL